ncbi:hypothetical protein HMPREF0004_3256 [Achromobacter piechaudii ATCC 43553]|uniref:Uncharacterized protein n=1 Tax=Achromobacter piechaudii ATCC 43553 TaxID=742159 RepID=D4XCQ9_9BURK|nr:hypothetical protein HMPREF0004_3256 [Achromobacter piechaudii ATCC 43553]
MKQQLKADLALHAPTHFAAIPAARAPSTVSADQAPGRMAMRGKALHAPRTSRPLPQP